MRSGVWSLLLVLGAGCGGANDPPVPPSGSIDDPELAAVIGTAAERVRGAPEDADAWARLGMTYQANSFDTFAEACYRRALALRPEEPKWWYHLAFVLERQDRYDDALVAARRAVELVPDYAPLHRSIALWALARGRLDEALAEARLAVDLSNGGAGALVALGRVQMEMGRDADAAEAFSKAIAAWPDEWGPRDHLHHLYGNALRRLGRHEEAARELALGRGEPTPLPDPWRAEVAELRAGFEADMQRAHHLLDAGQHDAAIARLQELRSRRPKHSQVLSDLGTAYLYSSKWREAIAVLEECVAAHPSLLDPHLQLSRAYWAAGQRDDAVRTAEAAVAAHPFSGDALEARGMLFLRSGTPQKALADFDKAARLDPTSAPIRSLAGAAHLFLEEFDAAKAEFDAALELDPAQATAIAGLAIVAMERGDVATADRLLESISHRPTGAAPLIAQARERRAAVK